MGEDDDGTNNIGAGVGPGPSASSANLRNLGSIRGDPLASMGIRRSIDSAFGGSVCGSIAEVTSQSQTESDFSLS